MTVKFSENRNKLIETERLIIREMVQSDFDALCKILCDEEVMRTAYGSAFNLEEAQNWLNRHFKRYAEYGFGLWAVVLKETHEMIGQCGLTLQGWRDKEILEIGYLFQKRIGTKAMQQKRQLPVKNTLSKFLMLIPFILLSGIQIQLLKRLLFETV